MAGVDCVGGGGAQGQGIVHQRSSRGCLRLLPHHLRPHRPLSERPHLTSALACTVPCWLPLPQGPPRHSSSSCASTASGTRVARSPPMPPAAPNTLVTCLVTCLITMRRKGTPLGRESHQAITVKMASREDDGHLKLGQPVMGPVRARAGAHAAGAAVEFVFPGQQLMDNT